MTVNSYVYLDINGKKKEFKVTEVWKLINDGKSISLQANSKSTFFGERTGKFVYYKARISGVDNLERLPRQQPSWLIKSTEDDDLVYLGDANLQACTAATN